jgi:hypothetical protein
LQGATALRMALAGSHLIGQTEGSYTSKRPTSGD